MIDETHPRFFGGNVRGKVSQVPNSSLKKGEREERRRKDRNNTVTFENQTKKRMDWVRAFGTRFRSELIRRYRVGETS